MSITTRQQFLEKSGLLHPHPEAITAPLFRDHELFFLSSDKVQVKYEMLRSHFVDGLKVTAAAEHHGFSRAAFYLIKAAFDDAGMQGLLDERRGRRGPVKLTPEILEFITAAESHLSGAQLALEIGQRFGTNLHRRTIERARK